MAEEGRSPIVDRHVPMPASVLRSKKSRRSFTPAQTKQVLLQALGPSPSRDQLAQFVSSLSEEERMLFLGTPSPSPRAKAVRFSPTSSASSVESVRSSREASPELEEQGEDHVSAPCTPYDRLRCSPFSMTPTGRFVSPRVFPSMSPSLRSSDQKFFESRNSPIPTESVENLKEEIGRLKYLLSKSESTCSRLLEEKRSLSRALDSAWTMSNEPRTKDETPKEGERRESPSREYALSPDGDKKEKTLLEMQEAIKSCSREKEKLKQDLQVSMQLEAELREQVEANETEIAQYKSEILNLKRQKEKARDEIEAEKERANKAEKEVAKLKQEFDKGSSASDDRVLQLVADLATAKSTIKELQEELETLREPLTDSRDSCLPISPIVPSIACGELMKVKEESSSQPATARSLAVTERGSSPIPELATRVEKGTESLARDKAEKVNEWKVNLETVAAGMHSKLDRLPPLSPAEIQEGDSRYVLQWFSPCPEMSSDASVSLVSEEEEHLLHPWGPPPVPCSVARYKDAGEQDLPTLAKDFPKFQSEEEEEEESSCHSPCPSEGQRGGKWSQSGLFRFHSADLMVEREWNLAKLLFSMR